MTTTTATADADLVPPLGPPPRVRKARASERTLANGLRVLVIRQPSVPLVELRLRIPFAGTRRTLQTHPARSSVLSDTMLAGTESRSQVEIAEFLQGLGADLSVSTDADRLLVSGTTLAPGLTPLLGLLAEILTGASYPSTEVGVERDRLAQRLSIARSQPSVLVREALARRMFGEHPYAHELPEADAVRRVTAGQIRRLHADRVLPAGSLLILVGDLAPARTLDRVEQALDGWRAAGEAVAAPTLPAVQPARPLIVHRDGSVQSAIRLGLPALTRDDEGYPAYQLANLIFGGYFSSRLTENIREDKGYTYTPSSRVDHTPSGSSLVVQADVATEVTAPALLEMNYELGRMATGTVTETELEAVRQYAIGTLALSIATQSGLASTVSALAGVGQGLDWLHEHPRRLAKVTLDEVVEQAHRLLTPGSAVTVVLGDAAEVVDPVGRLGAVEVERP
ncbi:MAG TPA: pitrilysin family protein [Mycobacteriales bacterium]|nr:pitrilysin family protein [Mycobacteriales bacterium]